MSLLPFDWGSRTHRRFVWLQMFKLEHCRSPARSSRRDTKACELSRIRVWLG